MLACTHAQSNCINGFTFRVTPLTKGMPSLGRYMLHRGGLGTWGAAFEPGPGPGPGPAFGSTLHATSRFFSPTFDQLDVGPPLIPRLLRVFLQFTAAATPGAASAPTAALAPAAPLGDARTALPFLLSTATATAVAAVSLPLPPPLLPSLPLPPHQWL